MGSSKRVRNEKILIQKKIYKGSNKFGVRVQYVVRYKDKSYDWYTTNSKLSIQDEVEASFTIKGKEVTRVTTN